MRKYAIGVDFGTLSGRAVLVELGTGREVASSEMLYPHGVMDSVLPCGVKLGPDWALQHPQDYLDVLEKTVPEVLAESGISPDDIIGLGIDFTACTILPLTKDLTPLCFLDEYKEEPHSYVKLWKHHAAQYEANKLNALAEERGETFLKRYGGKISSEWQFPKIMQIADEAPEIYKAAAYIMEAGDWIIAKCTGQIKRNTTAAGHKAIWHKVDGYPSHDFLVTLNPLFEDIESKLEGEVLPQSACAGRLLPEMAALTGLKEGIAVAVCNVDAHVAIPVAGIDKPGSLLMIIGTSTVDLVMGTEERIVPGMCGVVEDGMLPGYFGFEAGQSCMGDHFSWFTRNCVPQAYEEEAKEKGVKIQTLLTEKASKLKPGESGLLALDWWNGNRSVLVDVDLTGMMLGMTLQTKPEEIYRALIEATAYGARVIMDNFVASGVQIDSIIACGGIPKKNEMLMQIYADVLNKPIRIVESAQAPAVGSAMFGAVAAGKDAGGYETIEDAAREMGKVMDRVFEPIAENVTAYQALYEEYVTLYDYFGRGANDVMKRLKKIKAAASR